MSTTKNKVLSVLLVGMIGICTSASALACKYDYTAGCSGNVCGGEKALFTCRRETTSETKTDCGGAVGCQKVRVKVRHLMRCSKNNDYGDGAYNVDVITRIYHTKCGTPDQTPYRMIISKAIY